MKQTLKEKLVDWIDRPPSNHDLDVIDLILDLLYWTKYEETMLLLLGEI